MDYFLFKHILCNMIIFCKLHTSRISNVGICGKKSLPTKKHIKMKSSTMHSKSISNGGLGILISYSRYSLRVEMLRNCKIKKFKTESYIYTALSEDSIFRNIILCNLLNVLLRKIPGMVSWPWYSHHISHQTLLPSSCPFLCNLLLGGPSDHIENICLVVQEWRQSENGPFKERTHYFLFSFFGKTRISKMYQQRCHPTTSTYIDKSQWALQNYLNTENFLRRRKIPIKRHQGGATHLKEITSLSEQSIQQKQYLTHLE